MYRRYFKRIFDLLFAAVGIVIVVIPAVIIAITIKFTSEGNVFFTQQRFGINSKPFLLIKFRTMFSDAPVIANKDIQDITALTTKVGNFLRQTSLDELPQLINILKGEMSFIGPRPLADTDMKVISLRHQSGADRVLPGISGLAQVNGRNNLSDEDKAEFDFVYAKNITFVGDLRILFATVLNVVSEKDINQSSND